MRKEELDKIYELAVRGNFDYHKVPYRGITITKVIFNKPATIVIWSDGVKTVVKAQKGDKFDPEKGLAMAIAKRALGNKGSFNDEFKKWIK